MEWQLEGAGVAQVSGNGSMGVIRFLQADDNICIIEGTIDGLNSATHKLFIHEEGNLSTITHSANDSKASYPVAPRSDSGEWETVSKSRKSRSPGVEAQEPTKAPAVRTEVKEQIRATENKHSPKAVDDVSNSLEIPSELIGRLLGKKGVKINQEVENAFVERVVRSNRSQSGGNNVVMIRTVGTR